MQFNGSHWAFKNKYYNETFLAYDSHLINVKTASSSTPWEISKTGVAPSVKIG